MLQIDLRFLRTIGLSMTHLNKGVSLLTFGPLMGAIYQKTLVRSFLSPISDAQHRSLKPKIIYTLFLTRMNYCKIPHGSHQDRIMVTKFSKLTLGMILRPEENGKYCCKNVEYAFN